MVAVIMSIYKNDKLIYVAQCVDSLLKQTFKDFHVYVQYDGVVESGIEHFFMELNDSRFHVYGRDENYGLAYSLNELLTIVLSKGYDYVLRMDADDICLSNRFEKQIIYMNNHKNIDICGGHIEEMDENKKSIGVIRYPLSHDEMKCFFGKRNPLAHMSVIFRKSYFHKAGLYPVEALKTMVTIAERTEADIDYENRFRTRPAQRDPDVTDAISHATVTTALDLDANCIITVTVTCK